MLSSVVDRISNPRNCMKSGAVSLGLLLANLAYAGPSIGTGGGTAFSKLTTWLQNFVDFMSGPFGIAVVVVSIILAFAVWSFVPKEGVIGPVMRVIVSGLVILNVGTWLATLT